MKGFGNNKKSESCQNCGLLKIKENDYKNLHFEKDKNKSKINSLNGISKKEKFVGRLKNKNKGKCFKYTTFSIQKRLLSGILAVAFIFCLLIVRIAVLTIIDGSSLQIKAVEQWVRGLPLTASRGKIFDSNGNVLAYSKTSYNVYVRAKEIKNSIEVAKFLSDELNLDFEKTYEKIKNVYVSESLIKLQIDEEKAKIIANKNFEGIYLSENISREYPYDSSLAQVLGFLTSDGDGQTGLEKYYNELLSGVDGKYLTQSDVRGIALDESLNYFVEGKDGNSIKLNIDINIQIIVESVLQQVILDHNPKSVSAIVLNPNTSEIVAMAKLPSFDLNNVPRDDLSLLMSLVKNTMVTDVYEPGSTFKILTLTAALSEGLTNLNEHFYCPGYRIVDGQKIKCWKTTGHGGQTLTECVQNSCNCCFMDLALRLGTQKLYSYLKLFGIGSKTGVDISGESSGLLIAENLVKNVDLARIGFGQSVAVNQLQLVNSFCSIINGGNLMQPSLLSQELNCEDEVVTAKQCLVKSSFGSEDVSKTIRYLLEQSLSKTGEMTFVNGYRIAGKTGTAQKYGENGKISQGKYVSSFFGFLNSNDSPSYALLLCVDEPSAGAYYGSVVAKPYAKTIYEKIINYKNLTPDKEVEKKTYEVPNLIGESISQAIIMLEKLGVYYEIDGDGEKIVSQFPSAKTIIGPETTILIKTN